MNWAQIVFRARLFFFFLLYFSVEKHTSYPPFIFIVGVSSPNAEF